MIKGKVLELNKARKVGVVAWLFIDSKSQSRGYAGPLLEKLLKQFEELECDDVMACAHHLNTASSGWDELLWF